MSQWYFVLLSANRDRLILPGHALGSVVFLRGYYIIVSLHNEENNLMNCKPQSQRFLEEVGALATFQSMQPNEIQLAKGGGTRYVKILPLMPKLSALPLKHIGVKLAPWSLPDWFQARTW